MEFKQLNTKPDSKRGLTGAIIAAIAASVCCVGPLVLLALGVGGVWVGSLTALEPFRPYFISITFLFLGYAFYRIYRKPKAEECTPGSYCANPKSDKINKISLWSVTVLILILFSVPYIAGVSASAKNNTEQSAVFSAAEIKRISLDVPGMNCPACPFTVQKSLKNLDGVIQAEASLEQKKAVILFDPTKVSVKQMIEATTNAGYPSTMITDKNKPRMNTDKH